MTDRSLVGWGRAAAQRHAALYRARVGRGGPRRIGLPTLWLFTDTRRLPDPTKAAKLLPHGIAGVVFRHDDHPDRAAIGRDLARICRNRRIALVVAGDVRLAATLSAGVHLRGGRWPGPLRRTGLVTSSAHNAADLIRARRNGASLAFLSPAFPTASHPGEPTLGAVRWTRLARSTGMPVGALGGIDGRLVYRLRQCRAVGAIGALAELSPFRTVALGDPG